MLRHDSRKKNSRCESSYYTILFLSIYFNLKVYYSFTFLLNNVRIEEALSSCSASTGDIISTTERLQQELEVITQRQEIVSCFLRDYQLSNEEVPFPI